MFRVKPFQFYFYVTSWWSYIILADVLHSVRHKRFIVLTPLLPFLAVISAGYWCIFEIINVRIQNWHYLNLPSELLLRYTGYLLSFATVIPAVLVTMGLVMGFLPDRAVSKGFSIPGRISFYALFSGVAMLLLVLIFPRYAFALTWVFLVLIVDGYNFSKGYLSFIRSLSQGKWKGIVASALSGLICGFIWEALNYGAVSKWIYTVPFFAGPKLFEMPLPGYLGFIAFGIETAACVHFIDSALQSKVLLALLTASALCICLAAFPLIDRYTVISFVSALNH